MATLVRSSVVLALRILGLELRVVMQRERLVVAVHVDWIRFEGEGKRVEVVRRGEMRKMSESNVEGISCYMILCYACV